MDLNSRVKFIKLTDSFDLDGYKNGTSKEILYSCWASVNKYFSKIKFDSLNLDITKSLNITIRFAESVKKALEDTNNLVIEYNNGLYKVQMLDILPNNEFINIVGSLNE